MDLSEAYHCVNHDLIIATLETFDKNSLSLTQNYPPQRQQRVKVGASLNE